MKKFLVSLLILVPYFLSQSANALVFSLVPNTDVIGKVKVIHYQPRFDLREITRDNDIGYYELLEANPTLNPGRIVNNTPLVIPTQYVLPNAPHQGIVINLAELRLYYFPANSTDVVTMPIGIGRQGWDTPQGKFKIIEKIKNPAWHVPKSIAEDAEKQGVTLPKVMPAGPDNPLGDFAMRLDMPAYLLHGTNQPDSLGTRASSGCIRMYPEDIESLFAQVPVNTPVTIVNQPHKIGWNGEQLVMESHKPLSEMRKQYSDNKKDLWAQSINNYIATQPFPVTVDWANADRVAKSELGIPDVIGMKAH